VVDHGNDAHAREIRAALETLGTDQPVVVAPAAALVEDVAEGEEGRGVGDEGEETDPATPIAGPQGVVVVEMEA